MPRRPRAPRTTVDSKLANFLHGVLRPADAPPTRHIVHGGINNTAVQKRVSMFTLKANVTLKGQTEIFVVYNDVRDPFIVYKDLATSGWGNVPLVAARTSHQDLSTYTVPLGSNARIVSAQVTFEYFGPSEKMGGIIFHFPYDPDNSASGVGQLPLVWGQLQDNAAKAVSRAAVSRRPVSFIKPPENTYRPVPDITAQSWADSAAETAAWTPGVPAPLRPSSVVGGYDVGRFLITSGADELAFIVTITEHIEYYHSAHHQFSQPAITHPKGEEVAAALNTALTVPNSGNTLAGASSLQNIEKHLHEAAGVVQSGVVLADTLVTAGKVAAGWLGKVVKTAGPIVEEVGEAALVLA